MEFIKVDEQFKDLDQLYKINEEAFPDAERIPAEHLLPIFDECHCDLWAIYDETLVGFTVMMPSSQQKMGYLWFLAIDHHYRHHGYGSQTLQKLNEIYPQYQFVIDLEQLDEQSENAMQREKRVAFYQKNGFKRAYMGMSYFGVDYEIMHTQDQFVLDDFKTLIKNMAINGFDPKFYPLSK